MGDSFSADGDGIASNDVAGDSPVAEGSAAAESSIAVRPAEAERPRPAEASAAEDDTPQFVVVTAQAALGASLQAALRAHSQLQVVASESPLEASSQLDPDLMIIEVTEKTEAACRALVDSNPRGSIVFIGPLGPANSPGVRLTRNAKFRELSADVSVAEIVRVVNHLLHGEALPSFLVAQVAGTRSAPVQVLPRPSEPPPSLHSLPAPLLPSAPPPSGPPSGSTGMPSGHALGMGLLEDGAGFSPTEYSQELQRILADAERRVMTGLRQRPTVPPLAAQERERERASSTPSPRRLTAELRAALSYPIGDAGVGTRRGELRQHTEAPRTGTTGVASPGSQVPTTIGDADDLLAASDAALPRRLSPLPPSYPPAAGDDGGATPSPDTGSYPEAPTAKPPPPGRTRRGASTGHAEATAVELPNVPPAPGVPRGPWVGQALGNFDEETHGHDDFETGDGEESFPVPPRKPLLRPPASRRGRQLTAGSSNPEVRTPIVPRVHPVPKEASVAPQHAGPKPGPVAEFPPLRPGDSVRAVARAVRERFTGTLTFEAPGGVRRLVVRDGDFVTAASGFPTESLLTFLVQRGILPHEVETQLAHKLPAFGRHAGAALVAGGHLAQDQLWPVLRAHAEFVVANVLQMTEGIAAFEDTVPERLQAEPAVFGGATGSEMFVEMLRILIEPARAVELLGGPGAMLRGGSEPRLLEECAFSRTTQADLEVALRYPLGEAQSRFSQPEFACVLYALVELRALSVDASKPSIKRAAQPVSTDRMDAEALRRAVRLRRALVDEGDYFAFLGVPRHATGYAIRSAYLELRQTFALERAVAAIADLTDDLVLISEVLDEAYEVLGDQAKRERYLRAIESMP